MRAMTAPDSSYTFGIEEELFLVDPVSRCAVTRMPKRFLSDCRRELGERIGRELLQSQIEIVSPVFADAAEAAATMTDLRRRLAGVACRHGLRVLAAGTQPMTAWRSQAVSPKERYARLLDDYQILGLRNLVCGLHVHVGVPASVDRVRVMNRLLPWLPVFLALSASSPFWSRQSTGLHSYRQAAYDEWPRTGIPDAFEDQADYDAFADLLERSGAIESRQSLWWAIRPSHRFPTLELRIADSCTRLDDALALATLYRCLVHAHVEDPALGRATGSAAVLRRLADENRWRAKRHGVAADFIDAAGSRRDIAALLDQAEPWLRRSAEALGIADVLGPVRAILIRGSSADRQLAIYRDARDGGAGRIEALHAVVDWLIAASLPAPGLSRAGHPDDDSDGPRHTAPATAAVP